MCDTLSKTDLNRVIFSELLSFFSPNIQTILFIDLRKEFHWYFFLTQDLLHEMYK